VVLSAKTPDGLEQSAINLREFLADHETIDLADVAYTLQVGRETMTYRAVFLVRDTGELIIRLQGFTWPASDCQKCFTGEAKKRNRITLSSEQETLQKAISLWRDHGKGDMLAQLWSKGADFDWELLYEDVKPRRISLPNYPFARRYFGILPSATSSLPSMLRTPP
jgi:polyketide synthase PksN